MDEIFKWLEMFLKESDVLLIVGACLIVFFQLKDGILNLLWRLQSFKFGDYGIDFREENRSIKIAVDNILAKHSYDQNFLPSEVVKNFDDLIIVAHRHPDTAVLYAWRELELTAITLAYKKEADITGKELGRASGVAAIKAARDKEVVDEDTVQTYERIGESVKLLSKGKFNCLPSDAINFCNNAKKLSIYLSCKMN